MVERGRRLGAYMQATATSQTALRDANSVMQRTAADLSRMVKKSETPSAQCLLDGAEGGALGSCSPGAAVAWAGLNGLARGWRR